LSVIALSGIHCVCGGGGGSGAWLDLTAGFEKWGDFPEFAELDGVWRDLWILGWKTESPER